GLLLQITQLDFTKATQLVGGELEAGPLGDLRHQVGLQLALGAEAQGLALQRLTRSLAAQAQVFEVVALQLVVETQRALQFGARAHDRLVAAEEGVEFERNRRAFTNGAGAQLDTFGAELLTALGV